MAGPKQVNDVLLRISAQAEKAGLDPLILSLNRAGDAARRLQAITATGAGAGVARAALGAVPPEGAKPQYLLDLQSSISEAKVGVSKAFGDVGAARALGVFKEAAEISRPTEQANRVLSALSNSAGMSANQMVKLSTRLKTSAAALRNVSPEANKLIGDMNPLANSLENVGKTLTSKTIPAMNKETSTLRINQKASQLTTQELNRQAAARDRLAANIARDAQNVAVAQQRAFIPGSREYMQNLSMDIKDVTRAEKALIAQKKAGQGSWMTGITLSKNAAYGMNVLSSSAAGAMMGMAALEGNLLQLGFSLIFLKFSMVPVAVAMAGLTILSTKVVKEMKELAKIAKTIAAFGAELRIMGYSSNIATVAMAQAQVLLKTFGFSAEDAAKGVGALSGANLDVSKGLSLIASMAAATGSTFEELSKSLLNLLRPTEFTVGSFDDFRQSLNALIPASVRSKNGALDLLMVDAKLYGQMAAQIDGNKRMGVLLDWVGDKWSELGTVHHTIIDGTGQLTKEGQKLVEALDPLSQKTAEVAAALSTLATQAIPAELAFKSLRVGVEKLASTGNWDLASAAMKAVLEAEGIDPNKAKDALDGLKDALISLGDYKVSGFLRTLGEIFARGETLPVFAPMTKEAKDEWFLVLGRVETVLTTIYPPIAAKIDWDSTDEVGRWLQTQLLTGKPLASIIAQIPYDHFDEVTAYIYDWSRGNISPYTTLEIDADFSTKMADIYRALKGQNIQVNPVVVDITERVTRFVTEVIVSAGAGYETGTQIATAPPRRVGGGHEVTEYQSGGLVPGSIGSPQLAVVHGGEFVVPANARMGGGSTIVVDLRGSTILSEKVPESLVDQISKAIGSRMTTSGSHTIMRR